MNSGRKPTLRGERRKDVAFERNDLPFGNGRQNRPIE